MIALTALLLSLECVAPSNEGVLSAVRDDFERAGRTMPPEDPALSRAARELAERALTDGADDAASLLRITAALSRNGGWDPSPHTLVIRGKPEEVLELLAKNELAEEPASLVGAALVENEIGAAIAVLLALRTVDLEPFPRRFTKIPPARQRLCGALRAPLTSAELFVTRPGGEVEHSEMSHKDGRVCGATNFSSRGRHTVELLASGPRGPQVAALFFVDVGAATPSEQEAAQLEPASDADARAQLLVRINALRLRMGLSALKSDTALNGVAQAWAARLATENFFTHVAPDGSDLKTRLVDAGYRFTSAGENLGLASGPLAAHFGIEHSPGHRRNLLEKNHERLGVGVARRADGLVVLVEVLARPDADDAATQANPSEAAYRAIASERTRRRLPKLKPSALLEAIAQQHARDALEADTPKAQLPGRKRLHDQVFDNVDEAKTVAVDVFIAESPTSIVESKNLSSTRSNSVGIGVARGDSAQYGKNKYWIVVIYAGPN